MKICQFWGRKFISLSQRYEEKVRKFSFLAQHHFQAGVLFLKKSKACNCTKIGFHRGCFPRNFSKFAKQSFCYMRIAALVDSLCLHRYLHIFPIHFYLNLPSRQLHAYS